MKHCLWFIQIAHDVHPQWTTACEFFDDDTFICAEDGGNLISCHKDSGSTKENERNILKELGLWHLGENINVFRHGKTSPKQSHSHPFEHFRLFGHSTNS